MSQHENLLDPGNMSCDVFDGYGILHIRTVALAFYACFVDQHATIGGQTLTAIFM